MTEHASVKKIWGAFLSSMEVAVDGVNKYEAYSFGNDEDTANQLAALVMAGKKRGTSSLYALYETMGARKRNSDNFVSKAVAQ